MKPDLLAIAHSQITDAKLRLLADVFTSVKNEASERTANILSGLIVDDNGVCKNCKENRLLVVKALNVTKKLLKEKRPMIKCIYADGAAQIEVLANDYIQWLRKS